MQEMVWDKSGKYNNKKTIVRQYAFNCKAKKNNFDL